MRRLDVIRKKVEEKEAAIARGEIETGISEEESKEVFMGMKENASNKENNLKKVAKPDDTKPEKE